VLSSTARGKSLLRKCFYASPERDKLNLLFLLFILKHTFVEQQQFV